MSASASVSLVMVAALHAVATLFMVGLIWFVQVVHYPMFDRVGSSAFLGYARAHQGRTTLVVAAPMLIELGSSLWLLVALDPADRLLGMAGLALLALIWLSTALLQLPCHARLVEAYDAEVVRRLVFTNWIRTISWSARGALAVWLLFRLLWS